MTQTPLGRLRELSRLGPELGERIGFSSTRARTQLLGGRLCPHQSGYQRIEIGGVDVADGDDAELLRRGRVDGKSGAGARQRRDTGTAESLRKENRDFVFVDSEEEQRSGLSLEIGKVCALEGRVWRESLSIGKIEAEGKAALEPGFHGMAIGRNDLRGRCVGKGSEVLVEQFGGEGIGFM